MHHHIDHPGHVTHANADTDTPADPPTELRKKAELPGGAGEEDTASTSLPTTEPGAKGIPAGHGVRFQDHSTDVCPDVPQNSGTVQHSGIIKACSVQFGCMILPGRLEQLSVAGCFGQLCSVHVHVSSAIQAVTQVSMYSFLCLYGQPCK